MARRGSPGTARRTRPAARARPRCPRRTRPGAGGPRSPPSAGRARALRTLVSASCSAAVSARSEVVAVAVALPSSLERGRAVPATSAALSPRRRRRAAPRVALEAVGEARGTRASSARGRGSSGRSARPPTASSASASSAAAIAASTDVEVARRRTRRLRQLDSLTVAAGDDRQRALGADDELREVERLPSARAGSRPTGASSEGSPRRSPRAWSRSDRRHAAVHRALERVAARAARALGRVDGRAAGARAVGEHDVQLEHVVDRHAVDDRLAAARSCCRSSRRASPGSTSKCPARRRGRAAPAARLSSSCTTPGLDPRRARLDVDGPIAVHVARHVEHEPARRRRPARRGSSRRRARRPARRAAPRRAPPRRRRPRRAGTRRRAARSRTGSRRSRTDGRVYASKRTSPASSRSSGGVAHAPRPR